MNAIKAVALNRKIYRCRFYFPGNICFSVSGMDSSIISAAVRAGVMLSVSTHSLVIPRVP